MSNKPEHLFKKYFDGTASADEKAELAAWISNQEHDSETLKWLSGAWAGYEGDGRVIPETDTEAILQKIVKGEQPAHKITPARQAVSLWRYATAAAIILSLATGYWLFFIRDRQSASTQQTVKNNDVPPGQEGAILELSDGRRIVLDSVQNGNIAMEGQINIIKKDGQIIYGPSGVKRPLTYNTMTTPRGRQFQLLLPDGTKVWLNAASSITYPAAFTGNAREVTITGEAYFEVAKNPDKVFRVNISTTTGVSKGQVEVLGTHFNINSYADEPAINTTLLEGSVKVTGLPNHQAQIITPGQQARLGNELTVVKDVLLSEVIAWKEGYFHFESADLRTILRAFARWYDVEVIYEGEPDDRTFFGIVSRQSSLQEVLKMLQANDIQFRVEGRKLFVQSG